MFFMNFSFSNHCPLLAYNHIYYFTAVRSLGEELKCRLLDALPYYQFIGDNGYLVILGIKLILMKFFTPYI